MAHLRIVVLLRRLLYHVFLEVVSLLSAVLSLQLPHVLCHSLLVLTVYLKALSVRHWRKHVTFLGYSVLLYTMVKWAWASSMHCMCQTEGFLNEFTFGYMLGGYNPFGFADMSPLDSGTSLSHQDFEYCHGNLSTMVFLTLLLSFSLNLFLIVLILVIVEFQINHQCRCMCQAATSATQVGAALMIGSAAMQSLQGLRMSTADAATIHSSRAPLTRSGSATAPTTSSGSAASPPINSAAAAPSTSSATPQRAVVLFQLREGTLQLH